MTGTRKEKLLCLIIWINYNEQYNCSQKKRIYRRNLSRFTGIVSASLACLVSNYSTIRNDFKEQQFHFLDVGQNMFMCKL